MPLQVLPTNKVNAAPAKSKKTSSMPSVEVAGMLLKRFSEAKSRLADAAVVVEELEPMVRNKGLSGLFEYNIANPDAPTPSVRLVDDTGARVVVTMQNRYSAINVEAADAVFTACGGDINNHLQMTVAAKFDSGIFISAEGTPSAGEFSKKIFEAYQTAVDKVTKDLITRGLLPVDTVCPLSSAPVASVRAGFHTERWAVYKDASQQESIHEVVKATVTMKAVVD